jgi:hypothetical protein
LYAKAVTRGAQVSSPRLATAGSRSAAARAFARSLSILLKYVRLYGNGHKLASSQFETAWRELRCALPSDPTGGFLFGVSGAKLLLDGVPLAVSPVHTPPAKPAGFSRTLQSTGANLRSRHPGDH